MEGCGGCGAEPIQCGTTKKTPALVCVCVGEEQQAKQEDDEEKKII